MTIELTPIADFKPTEKGIFKYLVKTKTLMGHQYLQATVHIGDKVSIGVSNQIVTHISKEPLP